MFLYLEYIYYVCRMIKNITSKLLLLLAILAIIPGCSKDKKEASFSYVVNNFGDVSVSSGGSKDVSYEIKLVEGSQQTVTLSTKGLPSGIKATFSPASGTATFTSVVNYTANASVAAGSYPFTLVASTSGQPDKEFNANIMVSGCAPSLVGIFTGAEECTIGADAYSIWVSQITGSPSTIRIDNLYNDGYTVMAYLDCATGTLGIPSQISNSATIAGTGTFTANSMRITYTVANGSFANTCTANFTK